MSTSPPTLTREAMADKEREMALFEVTTADEHFYLVVNDAKEGDFAKQLCKALGKTMREPLPRPLNAVRIESPVRGRVKP